MIGDILVYQGALSYLQRHEAVCRQWNTGLLIGEIMQGLGFITTAQLAAALQEQQWRRNELRGTCLHLAD